MDGLDGLDSDVPNDSDCDPDSVLFFSVVPDDSSMALMIYEWNFGGEDAGRVFIGYVRVSFQMADICSLYGGFTLFLSQSLCRLCGFD